MEMRSRTSIGACLLLVLILAATIPGTVNLFPVVAVGQEENVMDESRPHSHLYVGRISGVQMSNMSSDGRNLGEYGAMPDWIQSGSWIARVKSVGEELTVGFKAVIDMVKPDGSARHRHLVSNFQLGNVSASEDNSTIILLGTATVTMRDGPVTGVPITFTVHGESLAEIVIGPERVDGHFGPTPLYATFTYAKTSFLDTGESTVTEFPGPIVLPSAAEGPAIPAKGYLVEEIKDDLYWVTDGTYNAMFLVGQDGVAAVDVPPTIGDNYLKAIEEVTDKPVKYVIYSHSHLDHIGAAQIFQNATFIAQENTARELQLAHDTAGNGSLASQLPPVPTVTFKDNYTLTLDSAGSHLLQLDYHGNNHVAGNTFVYAPGQKVLMLVDIVFPGWVPFMELAIAKDVAGFVQAHDAALSYDFETYVGGHLTRLGTRQDVETQKEFVTDLIRAAADANASVSFADIAREVDPTKDTWAFYGAYVDAVNKKCAEDMLSKWSGVLGGAEAFMPSHCWAMSEAMRVDPAVMALSSTA